MKILILIPIFFLNCLVKNKSHSNFWEHFFNNHHDLQEKNDIELYNILFGALEPKLESKVYQKLKQDQDIPDNKSLDYLYLSASATRNSGIIQTEIHSREFSNPNEEYFTKVEYRKSSFKNNETYKIKRITELKYPKYSFKDFLNWFEELSIQLQNENRLSILNSSVLYKFLCNEFRCSVDRDEQNTILSFGLDSRMATNYKTFYNRLNDILSKSRFKTKIFSRQLKIAEIYSEGKIIYLKIFPLKNNDLTKQNMFSVLTEVEINFYGLRISISNIDYLIQYRNYETEESIKGGFLSIPKYKLQGKVFYFLPQSVVNAFIPGDLDTYFADYLELLAKSNDEIKGNLICKIKFKENISEVYYEAYSEVMQKPFKPLANNQKQREGGDFMYDMRMKIVEDILPIP